LESVSSQINVFSWKIGGHTTFYAFEIPPRSMNYFWDFGLL
jgi:hypothetical protein